MTMLLRRLRYWLGSARRQRELREEMESHIAERTAELRDRGLSESAARRQARSSFGNVARAAEDARAVWTVVFLDLLVRDLRYAFRVLGRSPGFTAVVVFTLALGIGAGTAIFSIADRALFRRLPYADGHELVTVYESEVGQTNRGPVSIANWLDWQRENRNFQSLAAWGAGEFSRQAILLTDGAFAERLTAQAVSEEFFPLLRAEPALGRVFGPEDFRPGAPNVVILNYGVWQRLYGGDPGIIGRTIRLDDIPREVIGVMPRDFYFVWRQTDYWGPLRLDRSRDWRVGAQGSGSLLNVVGRLRPGVTPEAARAEMEEIAVRLARIHPSNEDKSVTIVPLRDELVGNSKAAVWILFAASGVLSLIACLNFAGLLLARLAYRRPEMAVRAALGAGELSIVRHCLAEGVVLALAGGAAGVLVARASVSAALALAPPALLPVRAAPLDGRVLAYALCLSLLTGVAFGLAPAVSASRSSLTGALNAATRSSVRSPRFRKGLVIAQIAMTVVLLSGAGLLLRSFRELTHIDTGLDPRNVLTMNIGLDGEPYDFRQQAYVAFYRQAIERIESLPGVQSAGGAGSIPVTGGVSQLSLRIRGAPGLSAPQQSSAKVRMVTPGYFQTLGIPMLRGRDFSREDRHGTPLVFVVNEAFMNAFLPDGDLQAASISLPLNMLVNVPSLWLDEESSYGAIIGVVGDVREGSLKQAAQPTVFYTYSQVGTSTDLLLFIKAENAAALAESAAQIIREIDNRVPVIDVRLLEDRFAETLGRERLAAVLSGAFALTALLLAASGVYALLSFQVAERTREIGIRMALGGQSSGVLRMVLGESLRLVLPGVALGLAAAFALTRSIESLLYGVPARDPFTFAVVVALMVVAGVVASFLPALRATRVDPLIALRQE